MKSYWIATTLTTVFGILTLYIKLSFWVCLFFSLLLVWLFIASIKDCYEKTNTPSFEDDIIISMLILLLLALSLLLTIGIPYCYNALLCTFTECCTDSWIAANLTALSTLMHSKVFGQHIAIHVVDKQMRGHLATDPKKPLVFSFHGSSGTGKNLITRMVVENMYARGTKSQYVHYISSSSDFPDVHDIGVYRENLKTRIETAVAQCPRSIFIIEDIDQMPRGSLESLRPYMKQYDQIMGVDYRKSIFFLLSHTGDKEIVDYVLESRVKGVAKPHFSLKDIEPVIRKAAFEKPNGLQQSSLISNNLISTFVPFLPIERRHVEQCIVEEMLSNDIYHSDHQVDKDKVEIIADEFEYFPNDTKLFVKSGCKLVREKINLILPYY